MAKATAIEAVLGHHVQALASRNIDEILKDYAPDAVLFLPSGMFKGPEGLRAAFKAVLEMLTPQAMANLKVIKQDIDGEYVYILWSALPVVPFGGDTVRIHNGKIVMQSFVGSMGS